jgi:hypothetical protein
MSAQLEGWRRNLLVLGYFLLFTAIAVHVGFWSRAKSLHGFWGHLDEAAHWMQAIDVLSLFALIFCLFGKGLRRWLGSSLAFGSFLLCCGYAAGL